MMKDHEFVSWMADRMVHVYGESPNVDFVHRARAIAENIARYDTAADNCEVLRARLDKYEDAEGNPIAWKASRQTSRSIHRNPDAKAWADFFVAVFPGQADKHELMIGWFANAMMAMHDHLKAQPSGVVLPERKNNPNHPSGGTFYDPYVSGWNACLDEVARLNSSPVSAGEKCVHTEHCCKDHGCKYGDENCPVAYGEKLQSFPCEDCEQPVTAGKTCTVERPCIPCFSGSGKCAVGMAERAAFEESGLKSSASIWKEGCYQYKTIDENGDEYFTAGLGLDNIKWEAWQARASLSAPNPGELEVLREYRTAIRNFNDCHGVETDTLEEGVEIERKAEARLEAAEKACHDFYAGREPALNHSEQVREYGLSRESLTLAYRLITKELETLANGSAIDRFKTAQGEFRSAIAAAPSAGSQGGDV